MTEEEIKSAANHSFDNRDEIEKSKMCGCYYCKRTFPAFLIRYRDYTAIDNTAICPLCGIDTVIGDASGVPINRKGLSEIYHYMFEGETRIINALEFFDNDEQQ